MVRFVDIAFTVINEGNLVFDMPKTKFGPNNEVSALIYLNTASPVTRGFLDVAFIARFPHVSVLCSTLQGGTERRMRRSYVNMTPDLNVTVICL